MQKNALSNLELDFVDRKKQLEFSISNKTQEALLEIQDYLFLFRQKKGQSCIELATFTIEKITGKPANVELLKKIYKV